MPPLGARVGIARSALTGANGGYVAFALADVLRGAAHAKVWVAAHQPGGVIVIGEKLHTLSLCRLLRCCRDRWQDLPEPLAELCLRKH